MKRSFSNAFTYIYEPIAKRTRANCKNFQYQQLQPIKRYTPWISATKTRNYFFNDHLSDWLKLYGGRKRSSSNSFSNRNTFTFTEYIKRKGIDFETSVVNLIKNRLSVVCVSDVYNTAQIDKTIEYMKQGKPVIHSAPLSNKSNNTYGIADLLVRNDYLYKFLDNVPIFESDKKALKLGVDYYYVVIDIKYQTLSLRSDGIHLLNSKSMRAYKSQLWIYNQALGKIQGYTPRYAYILGRRWKYTSKGAKYFNNSCLNKLGVIDFENVDKFIKMQTKFALAWNRSVIKNGAKWSLHPPTKKELYPNMGISGKYYSTKKKMAEESGELTMLWQCNVNNRNIALENGISSWKDPNCNSEKLGIGGVRGRVIDKIIKVNRDDKIITPDIICNNTGNWQQSGNDLFVDFETFSDICKSFDSLPIQESFNRIYLIGVGWMDEGVWKYKKFICKENTRQEELRIMTEFSEFVNQRNNPKLFYWHAEKNFWKRSCTSSLNNTLNHNWIDMCNIFRQEPIVINGCFGFGLKEIAKNMIHHNLISTKLESNCTNGMTAMIRAWKCYNDFSEPMKAPIMLDIIKYNEFDVQVLCDIVTYLRENHN